MREYIKKTSLQNIQKQHYLYDIPIVIIDPFTNDINIFEIINKLKALVPKPLLYNVDIIYVAFMKDFARDGRMFNAMYKDNAIYISPNQDSAADLLDDVIHEIAHSIEKPYEEEIYADGMLEREFLAKRESLYYLLDDSTHDKETWMQINYSPAYDAYLYNDIGYDKLRTVSSGLFYSPYAITSLREYWANGFENYLLGDKQRLKDLSPVLYQKIIDLMYNQEENL